jgi:hypothetical protein
MAFFSEAAIPGGGSNSAPGGISNPFSGGPSNPVRLEENTPSPSPSQEIKANPYGGYDWDVREYKYNPKKPGIVNPNAKAQWGGVCPHPDSIIPEGEGANPQRYDSCFKPLYFLRNHPNY